MTLKSLTDVKFSKFEANLFNVGVNYGVHDVEITNSTYGWIYIRG